MAMSDHHHHHHRQHYIGDKRPMLHCQRDSFLAAFHAPASLQALLPIRYSSNTQSVFVIAAKTSKCKKLPCSGIDLLLRCLLGRLICIAWAVRLVMTLGQWKSQGNCLADGVLPPTIFSVCIIVCLLQGVGTLVSV